MSLENVADIYPLTPTQEGMLFHSISDRASGAYVDQVVFDLQGELQFDRLKDCIQTVFSQYDVLRTAFIWDGVDQPLQVVRESVEFPVKMLSWEDQSSDEQSHCLEELIRDEMKAGFEVEQAPLIRVRAIAMSPGTWKLLIVFHHLILDGWSVGLLAKEVFNKFSGSDSKTGTACQFREFVSWHAQQDQQSALDYWQHELAGFEEKNRIGVMEAVQDSDLDSTHAQLSLSISNEESIALSQFAKSQRVTLNTLMVAAWCLAVARYSGQDDVVFGRTVAGRPAEIENSQTAIGNFINTLPFRSDLKRDASVASWLQEMQTNQVRQTDLEYSSLVDIQKQSSLAAGESLFDSILVFENYPAEDLKYDELRVTDIQHFEQSNYPLAFLIVPRPAGIELLIIYSVATYTKWFVERMLNFVRFKLQELCSSSSSTVGDLLTTLPNDEYEQLRQTYTPQKKAVDNRTVIELFRSVVQASPDAIAAVCEKDRITYRELDEKSNQLARQLHDQDLGVQAKLAVGICVDRSIEMLIGILGVLKSGCFYVPLDRIYPRDHFAHVIEDAGISTILTQRELAETLPTVNDCSLLFFDDIDGSTESVDVSPTGNDLAYAIYTSGSTGKPKGVMIDHCNLIESTLARSHYYQQNPADYLLLSSFAFDSSVAGIFWTLCTGGKLVMPRVDGEKDTFGLCQLIQAENVSHLLCLPVLYRLIVESCEANQLETLQAAIVAGDAVTPDVVEAHAKCLLAHSSGWKLFNEYGPTENSVWATVHEIQVSEGSNFPIGNPICNTGVAILDDQAIPVPVGALGEIALTGSGLSRGYIGSDDLTEKKFKTGFDYFGDPGRIYLTGDLGYLDGNGAIVFAGRKDRQVKVRGYRVELEEIEAVLASLQGVNEIAVVFQGVGPNLKRMACYFAGAKSSDRLAWKKEIGNRLADFMIPDLFVAMESLPKLPNGKINRKMLEPLDDAPRSTESIAPRNEIEKTLMQIWEEVLGVDQVCMRDNFFALGGDSILSIQVISRARRSGLVIKPGDIGLYPTIEDLALRASTDAGIASLHRPVEAALLSPMQEWFFRQNFSNEHHWNLSQLFLLSPDCDLGQLHEAIQFVLKSHPAFQYRFVSDNGQRKIRPAETLSEIQLQQVDDEEKLFGLQNALNVEDGPLFQLGLLKNDDGSSQLLFVVHHLLMDLVSWQIVIDDIEHVHKLIEQGDQPELPQPPTSFAQWVEWINQQVTNVEPAEIEHWNSISSHAKPAGKKQEYLEQDCEMVVVSLEEELTAELMGNANAVYNTNIQDLLLASLGKTLSDWQKAERVVIELESHGRDAAAEMDLSRTIGWFTATFPMVLDSDSGNLGLSIKRIKEKVRSVPRAGVLFNALCNAKIVHDCQPDLLFNYHGKMRSGRSTGILASIPGGLRHARAASNHRTHSIEINAVAGNRLEISWRFDRLTYKRELIEDLARQFLLNLEEIVKHCRSGKTQFTPSDFVESGLSQSELDDFLEDFD